MAFNFLYAPSVKFLEQYHIVIGATYVLLTVLPLHGMIRMLLRRFQKKTVIDLKNSTPAQTGVVATIKGAISVVSIQGPYFTPLLMATETIEIALQTWQAYRISKYISNLQINVLYGIGIFVSCWSTAVIHYVWEHKRRHPLMARFMSVLVDTMLDFLWGVVFQGVLIWKYWSVGRTVSAVSVLQEVPENADRELRQILVVSFSNFVLSGFPFLITSLVLHELSALLDSAQLSTSNAATRSGKLRIAVASKGTAITPVRKRGKSVKSVLLQVPEMSVAFFSVGMMLHGSIILLISIAATGSWSTYSTGTACRYRLYPWLSSNVSCVGRIIDCRKLGLVGNKTELAGVLGKVSPYLLGNLAFTNCGKLEMPPKIHDFDGLGTIAVLNSTLIEWDEDAAVNGTFQMLQTLQVMNVHVNCIPSGIMKQRLPPSLEWIRFQSIRGKSFINDVGDAWQSIGYFTCIDCNLTTIPAPLIGMTKVQTYALNDNSLTTIPGEYFLNKSALTDIEFAGSPITELPLEAWELLSQLTWIDLRSTNVSTIPAEQVKAVAPDALIFAYGSPLCSSDGSAALLPQVVCDEQSSAS